jgi:hypothetical protein
MPETDQQAGTMSWWQKLWRKPTRRWLLGIPIRRVPASGLGAVGWASFDATLHYTNTLRVLHVVSRDERQHAAGV